MRRGKIWRPGPLPGGGGCLVATRCHVGPGFLASERITHPGRGYIRPAGVVPYAYRIRNTNGRFSRVRKEKRPKSANIRLRSFEGFALSLSSPQFIPRPFYCSAFLPSSVPPSLFPSLPRFLVSLFLLSSAVPALPPLW